MKFLVVQRIYQQCMDTIYSYLQHGHSKEWSLGGVGSVALLDLWPNGFIPSSGWTDNQYKKKGYSDRLRVLWIADTNHVPVRYLAHLLPATKHLEKVRKDAYI